jgi:biotin/methionine sulfoxide reductase
MMIIEESSLPEPPIGKFERAYGLFQDGPTMHDVERLRVFAYRPDSKSEESVRRWRLSAVRNFEIGCAMASFEDRVLTATHWGTYYVSRHAGRLSKVEPWEGDPNPSPIGESLVSAVQGPLRIRRPAIRQGWLRHGPRKSLNARGAEAFVEVPWDEALDIAARELDRVRRTFGNQAIYGGSYGWASAGRFHHAQSQLHRFLNTMGGYTASTQTYSWAAGEIILPHVIGSTDGLIGNHSTWDTIVEHSGLIVAFGGLPLRNAQVQAGGLGKHQVKGQLLAAQERGARFVSISPLKDDLTSEVDFEWLWLRPNTDVPVMLALAYILISEGRYDTSFVRSHCVGFDAFKDYALGASDGLPKSPEWAAEISGIEASRLRSLAEDMISSRTMIMVNWAIQRADHGEQPYWMAVALAALLGQIGLPGGGFGFGYGSSNGGGRPDLGFKWAVLPQGKNPIRPQIPVARISDLLLDPGAEYDFNGRREVYPDIRLVYWAGGNPFHHHQDLNRLVAAWQQPETVIVNEHYWNPLAKHADIVLPACTTLERNDFAVAAREDLVVAMKQVIEREGESRSDFEILRGIAGRLGLKEKFDEGKDEMEWVRTIYDGCRAVAGNHAMTMPEFDEFWERGYTMIDRRIQSAVLLSDFRHDPERSPLATPSGKIEIFSEKIASFGYGDCGGLPRWYEPLEWLGSQKAARFPIHLLSCQPGSKLHSQYDHGKISLDEKVSGRAPIRISRQDANRRDIRDGDIVRVFNDRGACLAGARIDEDLKPGIAVLATGAWYDPLHSTEGGSLDKHGNPNVLTADKGASKLTQAPIPNSTLVEVEPHGGDVPAISAFDPPGFAERD